MAHPAPTFVPPPISRRSLQALVDADLVALLPGKMYRVCGLAAERERRSRGHEGPSRDPIGVTDETRQDEAVDETSRDTARASDDDPVVQYANLTGGFPSKKAADWIDDLTQTYGTDATIRALAVSRRAGASGVIGRAQNALRADARDLSKKERDAEEAKVQSRRVDGMLARRVEWFRNGGKWAPEWGPEPEAAA
jgi:hypothetical protein